MSNEKRRRARGQNTPFPPPLTDEVLDYSRVGTFVLDREFNVIWINKAIEDYFGLQRESVLGRDKRQLIRDQIQHTVAESEEFVRRVLATYENNTYVERFECRVLSGEGREKRWLEHWSQPIRAGFYTGGRIEHYTDITERKEAEQRARFQAGLLDAVEQAVIATDLDGRILYWNRYAERLYGWHGDEVLGKNIVDVTPAMGMAEKASEIMACLRQGESWSGTFRLQRRDGTDFFGYVVNSPIYDDHGKLAGIIGVSMDVSAQKQAEAQLRERTQVLETLNAINSSLAAEHDLEPLVQSITDAATDVIGAQFGAFFYNVRDENGDRYTLYTLSGAPREMFAHFPMPRNTHLFGPTFRGESAIRIDDVTQDPRYGKNPPYHGMPEGHLPVRSFLSVPVVTRSGEVLGGLFFGHEEVGVFTARDEQIVMGIATQASIAIESAHLYTKLSESERRFRTTFENAAVGIAHVAMDGSWLRVNQRFCKILGYSREELLQKTTQDLTHPDDVQIDQLQQAKLVRGELSSYTVEQRYIRKNGSIVWVSLTKSLQVDSTGTPEHIISVIQDITARKQAEWAQERLLRELENERTELEQRVQERTQQVRSLAAELSLAEHEERERIALLLHEHVQQMLYAVKMRTHLLELEMSEWSRTAAGHHLADIKALTDEAIHSARSLTVDLSPPVLENEGLPEALAWLSTQMKELYNLKVSVKRSNQFHLSDRSLNVLLFQMVRELLFNVVKHAGTDQATVSLHREKKQITICVADQGQGFDPKGLPVGNTRETGFGLHSIRERLHLFRGTMQIEAAPGEGTEVILSLPLSV